jgi:hypothetical protein
MQFTRIKYAPKKGVHLEWEERDGAEGETLIASTLTSMEAPDPAFTDALQAFVTPVLRLLELPTAYGVGMQVTGLAISRSGDDDRLGLVVTSLKALGGANAPLVLNTPHLMEPGDDAQPVLPTAMLAALEAAMAEAARFVRGHRLQLSLAGV